MLLRKHTSTLPHPPIVTSKKTVGLAIVRWW